MVEAQGVLAESTLDEPCRFQFKETIKQAGDKLEWVRVTISHQTVEIAQLAEKLREIETLEEESSSPEDDQSQEPRTWNNTTQEEDV